MKYPYVMVCIPVKNNGGFMQSLYENITKLDYPKNKITLCILESDSDDLTWEVLQTWKKNKMLQGYRKLYLWKHDFNFKLPYRLRQKDEYQAERCKNLGISRTEVAMKYLTDEEFILFLDADLKWVPPTTIKRGIELNLDFVSFLAYFQTPDGLRAFNIIWNNRVNPSNHPIQDCQHINERPKNLPDVLEIPLISSTAFMIKAKLFKEGVNFYQNKGQEHMQEQHIFSENLKVKGYKIYLDIKNIVIHW